MDKGQAAGIGLPELVGADSASAAVAAGYAHLEPARDTRRVLVAAIDATRRVVAHAPSRPSSAWAVAALADEQRPGRPRPWLASAPAGEGWRAVVIVDDASPPAELALRSTLVALAVARAISVERGRALAGEMRRLVTTAKHVALSLELDVVLQQIVEDAAALIGADSGDMLLLDAGRNVLRVVAVANFDADMLALEFPFGEGLSTHAMRAGQPLIVSDYQRYEHRLPVLDRYDFRSVLCAPLMVRDHAIGALNVHGRHRRREFTSRDAGLLAAFADLAAIAIDHAQRYQSEQRLARELALANTELTRLLTLQRRLSDQVVADTGIDAMVGDLAGQLGRSLVLHDHLGQLVAGASPDASEAWRSLVPAPDRRSGRPRRPGGRGEPALPRALDGSDARTTLPIRVGREIVAHLAVEGARATGAEQARLEAASTGIALEFAKRLTRMEVENGLRGDAVMNLLAGEYRNEVAITARTAHLGHDITTPHDVLVVHIDDADRIGEELGETTALRLKRRFADLVRARVETRAPGSLVAVQSDAVIVLLPVREPGVGVAQLAELLRQAVAADLPGVTVSIGIGDRTAAVADYAQSYRVARESVELMGRLGRRDVVVDARQLGAFRLLLKASSPEELRAFAGRTLGPLLDDEVRGSADLRATLQAYLAGGGNQRAAARACSVHVNTVVYRLGRIAELLGVDLADPDAVFNLTLALKIIEVAGPPPRA